MTGHQLPSNRLSRGTQFQAGVPLVEVQELGFPGAQAEMQRAVPSASISRDPNLGRCVPRKLGFCPRFLLQPVPIDASYGSSTVVGAESDKPNVCFPNFTF